MWSPPCVGPDRHAGDGLGRHPPGIAPLRGAIHLLAAKRNRHRRDEASLEPLDQRAHCADPLIAEPSARAFPLSILWRESAESSRRSSLATLVSGMRSGWPVPKTKRSVPMVVISVSR